MNATDVQASEAIERTPERIVERYRHNRDWRLYPKEWIYRNFPRRASPGWISAAEPERSQPSSLSSGLPG